MSPRSKSPGLAIVCLLVAATATAGCDRPAPDAAQADSATPDEVGAAPTAAAAPKAGTVDRSHKGEPTPAATFQSPAGKPITLAAFRGKPLLVNLWATWCAPCVAEMPTLDAAAANGQIQVISVSQDLDGATRVAPFFAERKFEQLEPYLDPQLGLSLAYQANLPTTIFYDAKGKELWRVTGGMDWTSAKAKELLAEGQSATS